MSAQTAESVPFVPVEDSNQASSEVIDMHSWAIAHSLGLTASQQVVAQAEVFRFTELTEVDGKKYHSQEKVVVGYRVHDRDAGQTFRQDLVLGSEGERLPENYVQELREQAESQPLYERVSFNAQ
jgi:hypothetical protein